MTSNNTTVLLSTDINKEYLSDTSSKYKPLKQNEFDELYHHHMDKKEKSISKKLKDKLRSKLDCMKLLYSIFPILDWLPNYKWKEDLPHDIVSGITVAVLHIPQGMAYSSLGGVPPIVGIYMAVFPVIIYICMGTSRHISMGTFSVVCMMTSKAVYTYSDPRYFNSTELHSTNNSTSIPDESWGLSPIEVASAVCITVGFWHVILGLFHLGSLSVLMSDIMISGFTSGTAVLVMWSQIPHVFGIKVKKFLGPFNVIYSFVDLIHKLHKTNFVSLGIVLVLVTSLIIYNDFFKSKIQKKLAFPLPIEMIVIVLGTLSSSYFGLLSKYNLKNVGEIPVGLPTPRAPPFELIPNLILDGLLIAIIAFSINISMASILSKKKYKVDSNQELLASGISNIFGSFFSCIPFSSSLSRSLVQLQVGGRTQLASGVSCSLLLFVLLYIGPFFEPLPYCVLASIVIVAVKGMLNQIRDLKVALRESYAEACVWCVTCLSVILLDVDFGLALGVITSLLFLLNSGRKTIVYRMGRLADTNIYIEQDLYQSAEPVPNVAILKIIGSITFLNKDTVFEKITKLSLLKSDPKDIIIDMTSVSNVDTSTVKAFTDFYCELDGLEIRLHLVKLLEPVKSTFVKCKFFKLFPVSQIYPTVHDAVLNCSQLM